MPRLTEKVRMLFDGKNFAVLSTLEPDGKPHSTVVWVKRDGDDIVFALPKTRRKTANLNRDPRAAVAIFDAANPYESAQVQGTASMEDDPGGMLVDELSHKYLGQPYPGFAGPNPEWVNVRITADKVHTSWPDSDLDERLDDGQLGVSCSTTGPGKPAVSSGFLRADDGTRTHDLLHGKQTL